MLGLLNDIKNELKNVEKQLQAVVQAPDQLITETSTHLLDAGGKRLRPALSLLGARFYSTDLQQALPLAVALELIHMATLVHDDVVDASLTRRGIPTVKAKWGNRISTHIGDYLLAKSLILISQYDNPLIPRVLADTCVKMCEGEIQQISTSFDVNQNIKDYFYRIKRKTALLIAASCQLGAVACGAPRAVYGPLRRFGHNIGMAFQITDDILDMIADQQQLGKPIGSDLRQGIITLPIIYALKYSPDRSKLKDLVLENKSDEQVQEAIEMVKTCGAIEYSNKVAEMYISKAKDQLKQLPDKPVKRTFKMIAEFISIRKF